MLAPQEQARVKGFAGYLDLNTRYQGRLEEPLARHVRNRGNQWIASADLTTTLQGDEA